jgi:hypothetical protein
LRRSFGGVRRPTGLSEQSAQEPDPRRIAYLFGSDETTGIVRAGDSNVKSVGCTDLYKLSSGDHEHVAHCHIPGNFKRLTTTHDLGNVAVALNLISNPDVNPKVLDAAANLLAPFKGKIINHPKAVLTTYRHRVAERLAGVDGLIVPKVVRFLGRANWAVSVAKRAEILFPAILRSVGTHNGEIVAIVPNLEALSAWLDANTTYYLTEFVEARSPDGFYHKYRVFFIGEASVIRHRLVSDRWSVHSHDRTRFLVHHPHLIEQERVAVEGGLSSLSAEVQATLRQIRARTPLDFFGVDFAVAADGRVILFEANASMNFFPFSSDPRFSYAEAAAHMGQRAFDRLLKP